MQIHVLETLADLMLLELPVIQFTTFATANVLKASRAIRKLAAVSVFTSCFKFAKLTLFNFSAPIPVPPPPRVDFERPDMLVSCLADGVLVTVSLVDPNFHGVMYVKGHSNDERCGKAVNPGDAVSPIDFRVQFQTCGLFHFDVSLSYSELNF